MSETEETQLQISHYANLLFKYSKNINLMKQLINSLSNQNIKHYWTDECCLSVRQRFKHAMYYILT